MPPALIAVGAIGAVAGAGASIYAANKASDAAEYAANQGLTGARMQAQAMRDEGEAARAFQERQANIARQDLAPFRKIGLEATQQAYQLASTDNLNFERDQSSKAIANRLSSQGLLRSNAFASNLMNLESQLRAEKFNRLAALGGGGQQAAGGLANISTGLGQNVAQNQLQNAGQIASLYQGAQQQAGQYNLAAAQAQAQGMIGVGNAVQSGVGNALQSYYMNKLFSRFGGAGLDASQAQTYGSTLAAIRGGTF